MKRFLLISACALLAQISAAAADHGDRLRVDCRFYSQSTRFCYSSAVYSLTENGIADVRFGVGCDYETIYDDGGSASPQEQVSDGLRPSTAAWPRVEITPEGSLRHPGTYTAKLETDLGKMNDGTCYVRKMDDDDVDFRVLRPASEYLDEIK